jgi:hypothetical protein
MGQPNGYILGEEAGAPSSVACDMAVVLFIQCRGLTGFLAGA